MKTPGLGDSPGDRLVKIGHITMRISEALQVDDSEVLGPLAGSWKRTH